MNAIDEAMFQFLNAYVGRSPSFDFVVREINNNVLMKGAVPMLAVWFLWFWRAPQQQKARVNILGLLGVSVIAITIGRLLQLTLPHRSRPLHAEVEGFKLADRINPASLDGWSSMPSDHAILFFSIAFGLFAVNRAVGLCAIFHALVFIALPRIYLGFHYPGDILVGIIVAALIVSTLLPVATRLVVNWRIAPLADSYPQIFYPALFLFTSQIATMFDATRELFETMAGLFF